MFDAIDYRWWKFIHLVGVFIFLVAHGVSVAVLFRVRKEKSRERIRELLALSGSTVPAVYAGLGLLLLGGIVATIQVYSFSQRWIWFSILILVVVTALMIGMASPYYRGLREALGARPSGVPRVSDEDLAERLSGPTPTIVAVVGIVGVLAILWLMIFKPI